MNSTNEINEYLKRLKNDERCLDAFCRAAYGYIRFVAYYYLVDKSFVDDVVNNTLYKIFNNVHKFDELQSGKGWISKIARNEAYSINVRERRHNSVSLEDVSEEIVCTTDISEDLAFAAGLDNALYNLDEIDRKIVELRLIEDMKYEDIAKKLNMLVGTVYKRFKRSVKEINKDIL